MNAPFYTQGSIDPESGKYNPNQVLSWEHLGHKWSIVSSGFLFTLNTSNAICDLFAGYQRDKLENSNERMHDLNSTTE